MGEGGAWLKILVGTVVEQSTGVHESMLVLAWPRGLCMSQPCSIQRLNYGCLSQQRGPGGEQGRALLQVDKGRVDS